MKRLTLTILLVCFIVICKAQEHLKFMDIPIAGTIEQFANKLVTEKGYSIENIDGDEAESFNMETMVLKGNFEMFSECLVVVRKIEGVCETSSVVVYIDSLKCLNAEFDKLNDMYDKKYGERSGYWGNNKWEINGARIFAGYQNGGCYVVFMNKSEVDIRDAVIEQKKDSLINDLLKMRKEQQTVKEICGVPFGSSFEKSKEMLENKYGYPEFNTDRNIITYKHKSYAGIMFNSIHFLFQSDGTQSYLNGCVFILDAKSLGDAKQKQEMLYKKLSEKYFMLDDTDSDGNKFYYGGYPPIPDDNGVGFSIEILKYDSELSRVYGHPYAARLAYGRYNYVKEEF